MGEQPNAQLALNLRRLRARAGLSQETLAHLADLHPNAIGLLERGQRDARLTTLVAIARALDASDEGNTVRLADLVADIA